MRTKRSFFVILPVLTAVLTVLCINSTRLEAQFDDMPIDGGGVYHRQTRPMTQEEADQANEEHEEEISRFRERLDRTAQDQMQIYERLTDAFVPPEAFEATIQRITEELIDSQVEMVGLEARSGATQRAIERLTIEAEDRIADDEISQAMEQIVDLRGRQVERIQALYGPNNISSQSEVDEARLGLLEAEIALAKHLREQRGTTGIDVIAAMNRQLLDGEIRMAELEVRAAMLQASLDTAKELLPAIQEYKVNTLRLDAIAQEIAKMDALFREVRAGDLTSER